jgi:hypothetical protein
MSSWIAKALILSPAAANLSRKTLALRRYHFQYHLIQWRLSVMAEANNVVCATLMNALSYLELRRRRQRRR